MGYAAIYGVVVRGLDEDRRLKIDALLGDSTAALELDRRRGETVGMMDVEVG